MPQVVIPSIWHDFVFSETISDRMSQICLADIIHQRRPTLSEHVAHTDTHTDTWCLLTATVPDG